MNLQAVTDASAIRLRLRQERMQARGGGVVNRAHAAGVHLGEREGAAAAAEPAAAAAEEEEQQMVEPPRRRRRVVLEEDGPEAAAPVTEGDRRRHRMQAEYWEGALERPVADVARMAPGPERDAERERIARRTLKLRRRLAAMPH